MPVPPSLFPLHFHPILSIASFTPLLYLYISFPKGWKRIYGIEKTKVQSENEMRAQPSFHVALCVCVCQGEKLGVLSWGFHAKINHMFIHCPFFYYIVWHTHTQSYMKWWLRPHFIFALYFSFLYTIYSFSTFGEWYIEI